MRKLYNRRLLIKRLSIGFFVFGITFSSAWAETLAALAFDGMDDLVEISAPPILGSTFTEEAWILPDPRDDKFHGIVGANASSIENRAPGLWLKNRTVLQAGFGDGTRWITVSSPPDTIVPNVWNHIAATYDGNTYRLFANGAEVATQTTKHVPVRQPVRRIGRVDYWFPGAIREVRLWNRALSEDELRAQIHKPLIGTERGLVSYFRLDDGSSDQARNSGPQGGKGTLLNGPLWINSSAPVAPALSRTSLLEQRSAGVETFLPNGDNNAPDAPIEITLQQNAGDIERDSIQLTLDQTAVHATLTTNNSGALLIRYEQRDLLEAGSKHRVKLSYVFKASATQTNDLSYEFAVSPNILLSK